MVINGQQYLASPPLVVQAWKVLRECHVALDEWLREHWRNIEQGMESAD